MGEFDDLVRDYLARIPEQVVEATNLWLAFEEGKAQELVALKRLLHTIKGEAHMLGLSRFGRLSQVLYIVQRVAPQVILVVSEPTGYGPLEAPGPCQDTCASPVRSITPNSRATRSGSYS